MSIEKDLKELEEITQKIESNSCSLDESLLLYKQGKELSNKIKKTIEEAKLQINYVNSED